MDTCFINSERLGKERAFCMYYGGTEVFSAEEVKRVKEVGDDLTQSQAKTFGNKDKDESRKGEVAWLPRYNEENEWVYAKLLDIIYQANEELWKFDLIGFWEDCQYTTYNAPPEEKGKETGKETGEGKEAGDFYDYHLDIDGEYGVQRKISAVVQLSDPKDYEGGELEIKTSSTPYVADKGIGSVLLFPSFCLHKVSPVTKGKRNSLVLWVSGLPFK